MSFGFDLLDQSGSKVMDSELSNYAQISEGSLYTDTNYNAAYGGVVPTPSGFTNCVFAYDIPVGKWLAIKSNAVYAHKSTGRVNIPYKVFAPSSQVQPSTDPFGLKIYNADSTLIFDSGKIVFNVASYVLFSSFFDSTRAMTMTSGRWLIPSVFGLAGIVVVTSNFGDFYSPYFYRHGGGQIDTELKTLYTAPGYDNEEPSEYYCSITEIDIT